MGLNSPIWNDQERVQIVSRCLSRLARKFKVERVQAMVAGPHTGRLYPRKGGVGFRRFHRASARGERPSPDTTNLINSLDHEKISDLRYSVNVDDVKAPYGKWLQDPDNLDRPIATIGDAEAFMESQKAVDELNKARAELVGSIGVTAL